MAYYVINKNTNEINPNAITNEVALFETEQDFINAKQKWINDNTVINDYKYIVATNIQKEAYKQELLAYRLANDNRTSIVINHKYNVNIEHTHRMNIAVYLEGQINEELGIMEFMYVETTGDLLNEFLANELILQQQKEADELQQRRNEAKTYFADKLKTDNTVYLICNTDAEGNIIKSKYKKLEGVDLINTINLSTIHEASQHEPVIVPYYTQNIEIYITRSAVLKVKKDTSIIYTDKDLLLKQINAYIDKSQTEVELDEFIEFYNNPINQDVDELKDGKDTIYISKNDIIAIYVLSKSIDVKMGKITKEETNITNTYLNFN
jgi:hypothetical protein